MNDIYPNAPLDEAIFEIRFPAELSIECKRDEYYEKIRSNFSNIFVPPYEVGKSYSLQPYSFRNDDHSEIINFSVNTFSYHTKKYAGFKVFRNKAIEYLELFCQLYKIKFLKRTGLRYINYIPLERKNDTVPIHNYLKFGYILPDSIPSNFEALETGLLSKIGDGKLRTAIGLAKLTKETQVEAILLDFDFYFEGNPEVSKLELYIENSHNYIKKAFEDIISDEYRNIMQGEVKI
ncbi:MAG: TIGR04255 family protein [Deltaproteobacteria bacterium]|nr:TIGR04255 family protein [Deltaproteobacteria bacterium]